MTTYNNLRRAVRRKFGQGGTANIIAPWLGRSPSYVAKMLSGQHGWPIPYQRIVIDQLGYGAERAGELFPALGGVDG